MKQWICITLVALAAAPAAAQSPTTVAADAATAAVVRGGSATSSAAAHADPGPSVALDVGQRELTIRPVLEARISYSPYNAADFQSVVDYPGGPNRERNFALRDANFGFEGTLNDALLDFEVSAGSETRSDGRINFGLENAFIRGGYRYRLGGSTDVAYAIRVGAMKIPFSRQSLTSEYKLQFMDRAVVIEEMPIRRDIGLSLDGEYTFSGGTWLELRAGVYNGRGHRSFAPDDNDGPMAVGRVRLDLVERMPAGEGDARPRDERSTWLVSLGTSVLYNSGLDRDTFAYGGDLELRGGGFSLLGEYVQHDFDPNVSVVVGNVPVSQEWTTRGYTVQAGQYILPERLELAARWQCYNVEVPANVAGKQRYGAASGVLTVLIFGHHLKVGAEYTSRVELEGVPDQDNDTFSLYVSGQL